MMNRTYKWAAASFIFGVLTGVVSPDKLSYRDPLTYQHLVLGITLTLSLLFFVFALVDDK